ncbi:hypothetical protein DB30_03909 [Enhygromyxa salina]|uniref:Uncharacterized protein n=1 Tax=Enhygromyxa salina TaxID=215803 RepID=A0A0C2A7A6_9BACT|nr:hypothetical protein DB30_03909 [Enhygromyxa salina]
MHASGPWRVVGLAVRAALHEHGPDRVGIMPGAHALGLGALGDRWGSSGDWRG